MNATGEMPHSQFKHFARRAAKAAWWLVTPWRMPQRMKFLRERSAVRAREAVLAPFVESERQRMALRRQGAPVPPAPLLDLFDDSELSQVAGVPPSQVLPLPVAPGAVTDRWSAAGFLIDLRRRRSDLRMRFPRAFTDGKSEFGSWLQGEGGDELGVDEVAVVHLLQALEARLSDRARQAFLASELLDALMPHGLTPVGMRPLFRWFMRCGMSDAHLRLEEVWWLFLEAAEDPARELSLAYCFAPEWQQRHPDGLTVFGRDAFANWFSAEYGASGEWLDASAWPPQGSPSQQIRLSYWSRERWREAHPNALSDDAAARALLTWLSSATGPLPSDVARWCAALDVHSVAAELTGLGANVIGHFCFASGLRVSAECMVEAMQSVGVATSLRDLRTDAKDEPHHVDFRGMEYHDVTIIHTQPEPFFDHAYRLANLAERDPRTYRVGYWYWEFDSIPDAWMAHAKGLDEVWTATDFVAKGLREKLAIPVRTMFPGVKLAPFERRGKSYFGLSEVQFTFLFTFHMMSVMERKNPLGLIRAFKTAFPGDEPVRLVLKTSFGDRHPTQLQRLRAAAKGANITVIDQVYTPDEVLSLMDACDAYVSLHRSEGLGLTMAEAMLMGKPVIATNFSGNVDFMSEDNSLLVPYELVKLGRPIPPYDAELEWAEPSIEHAARHMRRLYEDQAWAREIGLRGKASAEGALSLETAGRKFAGRLEEIRSRGKTG